MHCRRDAVFLNKVFQKILLLLFLLLKSMPHASFLNFLSLGETQSVVLCFSS